MNITFILQVFESQTYVFFPDIRIDFCLVHSRRRNPFSETVRVGPLPVSQPREEQSDGAVERLVSWNGVVKETRDGPM
jgi:hypothetical protein